MTQRAFAVLYACCLVLCVGSVQLVRVARGDQGPTPAPDALFETAIAVPPKPDVAETAPEGPGSGTLYDEATCHGYEGDFRDTCFATLARQRAARDPDGALLACGEIRRQRVRLECLADVAEGHARTDLDAARAMCPEIPAKKWRDQCYFGIAMALWPDTPDTALVLCEEAGMWRDFCRHDVLGEVAVVDLEFVLEVCRREQGDLLTRKTCWHGIGKYIGRQDLDAAFAACQQVPLGPDNLYRENCIHGAGWAAGERWGSAGADRCIGAGPQRDSCLLGVAFQLKNADPEQGVVLCQQAQRGDLREHCLAFLTR